MADEVSNVSSSSTLDPNDSSVKSGFDQSINFAANNEPTQPPDIDIYGSQNTLGIDKSSDSGNDTDNLFFFATLVTWIKFEPNPSEASGNVSALYDIVSELGLSLKNVVSSIGLGKNFSNFKEFIDKIEMSYLDANPDVAAAVDAGLFVSGIEHYSTFGKLEGRQLFSEAGYLAANLDVADAIAAGSVPDGLTHFVQFGFNEGRSFFNEQAYLTANSDVAAAVTVGAFASGAEHYLLFGRSENRELGV